MALLSIGGSTGFHGEFLVQMPFHLLRLVTPFALS